jgi:hypothetical protein
MKQDFNQFRKPPVNELPEPLPVGERVIWQGKPSLKGLALRSFHIREVAIYFGLLVLWKLGAGWLSGLSMAETVKSAALMIIPAVCAVAVLSGLAWLYWRASRYTITTKRVLFQFGVALPMTVNVPLAKIGNAALKTYSDGSGNIPLRPVDSDRVSYLLLWPHIRPWRLSSPEPMLVAVPDAAQVAARLAEALTGQPGAAAITLAQRADTASAALTHSTASAAA